MNIRTTYRLRKLSARGNIDRRFRIALKKRLLAQKDVVKSPHRWLKPLAVGMTTLLIFGMATGAYAYGSKSVLPDHPLYGVRAQIERVESAIVSGNPQKRAEVAIKHLERRVQEIDLMEDNEDQIEENDVERVSQAVKEAMDVAAETEETEGCDRKIRQAEMEGTQLFQRASERNSTVKKAVDKSVKDIGRVVWKMDESRRARYENIELRYEAELFGMHWKLEQGKVVVENEDIEEIIKDMPPESVEDVIGATVVRVERTGERDTIDTEHATTSEPVIDPQIEHSDHDREPMRFRERFGEPSPPVPQEEVRKEDAPSSQDFWSGDHAAFGTQTFGAEQEDVIRERLRNYFDRLSQQGERY